MRTTIALMGLMLSTVAVADDAYLVCDVSSAGWMGPGARLINSIVIDITGAGVVVTSTGIVIDITGAGVTAEDYAWVHVPSTGAPLTAFASDFTSTPVSGGIDLTSDGVDLATLTPVNDDGPIDISDPGGFADFASTAGSQILTPQTSALNDVPCYAYEDWTDGI